MPYKGLDRNDLSIAIASIESSQFNGKDCLQVGETLKKLKSLVEKELEKELKGG